MLAIKLEKNAANKGIMDLQKLEDLVISIEMIRSIATDAKALGLATTNTERIIIRCLCKVRKRA